jgi:hypothetical protein
MSTLSLRLPESLHRQFGELAEREGVSIDQLISSAVAEKMTALLTEEYLGASEVTETAVNVFGRSDPNIQTGVIRNLPLRNDRLRNRAGPRKPIARERAERHTEDAIYRRSQ